MADKPSRALVIYGDGYASLVSSSHYHLHSFASLSSCGFLALRDARSSAENDREVRDFSQLVDAYDYYIQMNKNSGDSDAIVNQKEVSVPKLSERFMGVRAAIFTDSAKVQSFASSLGFTFLHQDKITNKNSTNSTLDASAVLQLLGFIGGDIVDQFEYDIVFLHLASPKKMNTKNDVDNLNNFVGSIMHEVHPGSVVASRLHLSLALSYDSTSEDVENCSLVMKSSKETDSDLYLLRPRQSYTMKGGKILTDIRHHHPMLIAQWQEGVTRKDLSKSYSFEEFKELGANLSILADRFLHEVAFKLWKAPKYGA